MYLCFYMALGLNDYDGGENLTLGPLEGMGPENLDFFGPFFVPIKIITFRAI
jgi:hypothetical protein